MIRVACFIVAFLVQLGPLTAARYGDVQPSGDSLRHEVNNHEAELRMLREQLSTQEALIDSLRSDVKKASQEGQENGKNAVLKTRVADLEGTVTALTRTVESFQKKIDALAAAVEQQSKNSKHLEKGLNTLLDAVGADSASGVSASDTIYRVVDGDSLEKIARRHKTTIKALKELNGLDGDRIIIGQKLKIPK